MDTKQQATKSLPGHKGTAFGGKVTDATQKNKPGKSSGKDG